MRFFGLVAVAAIAQAPSPAAKLHVEFEQTPVWAAQVALQDAKSLSPDQVGLVRYVWLRRGTQDELASLSFVINAGLSQVNVGVVPGNQGGMVVLHGGRLVRLDLGLLATEEADLRVLVDTWEDLKRVETDFLATVEVRRLVKVPRYRAADGKWYTGRWETVEATGPAAHVAIEMEQLVSLAGSVVPIIDGRELIETALSTLNGGKYYEFRNIKSNVTLKEYLASRGASEEQVASLESLEKAVKLRSGVTGKERMVALFRGAGVRASTGGGLVALTYDPFDEDRSGGASAVRNLLDFRGRGSEVILERANGFHEWSLWNESGKLVRVAPPNLVSDHQVPEPHTRNLQPGISCVRCHGTKGDGWQGFVNDVPKILAAGTDIFGDLSSKDSLAKQQQLLAGLFGGDWFAAGVGPFAVGRLTYDRAVFRCTGKPIGEVSALIAEQYAAYTFDELDVWDVAREIGIKGLPESDENPETEQDVLAACGVLREFIGAQPVDGIVVREDAVVAAICAGIPISRTSYESCKHILMERAYSRSSN